MRRKHPKQQADELRLIGLLVFLVLLVGSALWVGIGALWRWAFG